MPTSTRQLAPQNAVVSVCLGRAHDRLRRLRSRRRSAGREEANQYKIEMGCRRAHLLLALNKGAPRAKAERERVNPPPDTFFFFAFLFCVFGAACTHAMLKQTAKALPTATPSKYKKTCSPDTIRAHEKGKGFLGGGGIIIDSGRVIAARRGHKHCTSPKLGV